MATQVQTHIVPDIQPVYGLRTIAHWCSAVVIAWILYYAVAGASAALWFDGAPGDGPFQIFNPLRRIAAGQTGGVDFIFYHGIGVPYLHYPLFALFGKTLAASELSRQWTTLILLCASSYAF